MTCVYPLEWPEGWARTPNNKRVEMRKNRLTFGVIVDKTYLELERLKASSVAISSWLPLNMRGLPYAEQSRRQLEDPGVAVYFRYRKKQMVMARDAFYTVADNLNSLRLAIQYLRGLERHGGGTMMDRAFEGFAKLPAPGTVGWQAVFGPCISIEAAEAIYRDMAKREHARGANHDAMVKLNLAIEEARQFFKEKAA
jgi:hypothetical protein